MTPRALVGKRLLDVVVSALLLVVLALPMMVIGLLVGGTSPGGAFFRQERVGQHGRRFLLWKFRTMVADAPSQGPWHTRTNDPRITRVGAILRRLSLDELPQILNVLTGDMSLVGPRPIVSVQEQRFSPEDLALRHSLRPGMTGLAQVSGRSDLSEEATLAYDLQYVREASVVGDLWILFRTIGIAATMKGTN